MERAHIRTYVRGLDEALGGGILDGQVILLCGAPGTMKSSLAFSILYENALRDGRRSAYFTLEQGKDPLLEQMAALGMADEKAWEDLHILDMGSLRKNLKFLQARGSWLELFKMYCNNVVRADKIGILVVDSLEVLEIMAKMQDRRQELYFLFEWLRDLGPPAFLISERPLDAGPGSQAPDEAFLADGILELGMHPTGPMGIERRLRIVKLRGSRHDMGYAAFTWKDGGFEVSRTAPP